MATVKITVRERIAIVEAGIELVCNNPTDSITFDFDEEWSEHNTKTARFSWDGRYIDVVFDGNTVKVPEIFKTTYVFVGVFSDGITTTPAKVPTRFSIKCHGGAVVEPRPDVYEQILEKLNTGGGSGGGLPSGGTPHQMLVTGADGNTVWEERTHYAEVGEHAILPETVITIAGQENPLSVDRINLVAGETYKVTYNGTMYECTAFDIVFNDIPLIGIGNQAAAGGANTGEPFAIGELPEAYAEAMGVSLLLMPLTEVTTATVKIVANVEIVKKIDSKYLPVMDSAVPVLDLRAFGLEIIRLSSTSVTLDNAAAETVMKILDCGIVKVRYEFDFFPGTIFEATGYVQVSRIIVDGGIEATYLLLSPSGVSTGALGGLRVSYTLSTSTLSAQIYD